MLRSRPDRPDPVRYPISIIFLHVSMKRIATALSSLVGLVALSGLASAQFGPTPSITDIPVRQADAPGNIVINGVNLGLVTEVTIDNVSVPIIRARQNRVIAGPLGPELPRFAQVRVAGGNSFSTGTLSLLPTLKAERRGFVVYPTIHNGATGTYILRHQYQAIVNQADFGIYGRRFLSPFATVGGVGFIPDANPFPVQPFPLPIEIGQIGEEFKLQAEVSNDTTSLVRYTNLAVVNGFGDPQ